MTTVARLPTSAQRALRARLNEHFGPGGSGRIHLNSARVSAHPQAAIRVVLDGAKGVLNVNPTNLQPGRIDEPLPERVATRTKVPLASGIWDLILSVQVNPKSTSLAVVGGKQR